MINETMPNFAGPLKLAESPSRLGVVELTDDAFKSAGLRAEVEERDLGLSAATQGKVGARHVRAILPFEKETGWHWHDMTGHFVYVLRGWLTFRFEGVDGEITVHKGGCVSQPGGVPHNVIARSDDLEFIEINMPATFGTQDLNAAIAGAA